MCAFGQQGQTRLEGHAGFEGLFRLPVFVEADVRCGDTCDLAVFHVKLGASEAGVDLYAELFGLLSEPACESTERNDVVSLVGHLRRVGHGVVA